MAACVTTRLFIYLELFHPLGLEFQFLVTHILSKLLVLFCGIQSRQQRARTEKYSFRAKRQDANYMLRANQICLPMYIFNIPRRDEDIKQQVQFYDFHKQFKECLPSKSITFSNKCHIYLVCK
jgi:hypothetical protein